jgi:membrane protein implicated in regulation of membrane protease activity
MHHKALVGVTAIVVARVDGHGGRVKIGGELWSARSSDGNEVIEPGARVTVMDISGATALVVAQD